MTPFLRQALTQIEETLEEALKHDSGVLHASLYDAARYSLLSGGKRLRPLLALAAAHDLGGDAQEVLLPACALELIHTYSLIHDDLPCMDDDDIRRGKPSLHRAFDEGLAVLTGDFFLTKAFELLATAPKLSAHQRVNLIQVVASRAGGEGMIGGQVVDVALSGKPLSSTEQKWINDKKTGALFTASLELGGIVAGASESDLSHLRSLGNHFGLAFQLLDDLDDCKASPHYKDLNREIQATFDSLNALTKPLIELKALIVNFYDHAKTAF